ncbi:MAG: hypothetical protein H0U97_00845 [Gammaproteobacteria bacterium]|nr:hypothetical protein [Gammaproteobacteria bacterium]
MTRLWAVYSTVDHRRGQILVVTQSVDATRRTADDAVNDVEWIVGDGEVEQTEIDLEVRIDQGNGLGPKRSASR